MLHPAFALLAALLLALSCAAPSQSAAPTLSPLSDTTIPPPPTAPPAPTSTMAHPVATRLTSAPPPTPPPAAWPQGSTPIAELDLTPPEAVAELARRYQVSPARIDYRKYQITILDAAVAPIPDAQDLTLTVTTRLRNYRNLPGGFELSTFDDAIRVTLFELDFSVDGGSLYQGNSAPTFIQQIPLRSRLDSDGKRIDRLIYINGQPLLDNFALNCSDYRMGYCPIGCLQSCTPSYCGEHGDTYICTADCGGPGSCHRP